MTTDNQRFRELRTRQGLEPGVKGAIVGDCVCGETSSRNCPVHQAVGDDSGARFEALLKSIFEHSVVWKYRSAIFDACRLAEAATIERVSGLLNAAICPMASQGCDGGGYPVPDNYGGWEQEQCQWCHERAALRALGVK